MSRLFDEVVRNSSHLWHGHLNRAGQPAVFSQSATLPSRDEAIRDYMSIPTYTPTHDHLGWSVMGERRYATREEAERAVNATGLWETTP